MRDFTLKMNGKKVLLFVLFLALEYTANASEIIPFFRGIRAQGMGGAGIAIVDDETALYINPAGLGKVRGSYLSLINPEFETNYDTMTAFGSNVSNYAGVQDPQALLGIAQRNPNKPLHAKVQVLPTFVTTNFALGAYANYTMDGEYQLSTNQMRLDYTNDYAAAIGYCFRLFEGRIKIGMSGKIINRVSVAQNIAGNTTGLTLANLVTEGTGAGWDLGLILTGPWVWLPTLSAVTHDVGNTYFNLGAGYFYKPGPRPQPIEQKTDVAFALFPYNGKTTRGSITVEWRDIQNPESADVYRRVHAGVEINLADILYLRGGVNQRYYTAGLELAIDRQQIQLATYGEEIGTATIHREDRRFIGQYSFRF